MKVLALLPFLQLAASQDFLWATSGGGWRAMSGSMAYANVFYQAGLFTDSNSQFTGVSSNSGGTWFSTQFFYSQQFYDAVAKSSPTELSSFLNDWMMAYKEVTPPFTGKNHIRHKKCEQLRDTFYASNPDLAMEEYGRCVAIREQDCDENILSWSCFINNMLRTTSENYGDPNFNTREMTPKNRISALKDTILAAMISLVPTAMNRDGKDEITYLGPPTPRRGMDEIYNTVLPLPWLVGNDSADWLGDYLDSKTYTGDTGVIPTYDDYEEYYTPAGGSTTIQYARPTGFWGGFDDFTPLQDPFGGSPNVVQIASASSAAGGCASPLTGAVYMQCLHFLDIPEAPMIGLYTTGISDYESVCGTWPEEPQCPQDGAQLIDGGNVDNLALTGSIAAYQQEFGTSNSLKVVLNVYNVGQNTSATSSEWPQFLGYFSTDFNRGIEPGGFLMYPYDAGVNPIPSSQIFAEELLVEDFLTQLQPVKGTQCTYATYTVTTIDNPVYGISAGQNVELLVFFLNYYIPTVIVLDSQIDEYIDDMMNMVEDISSSSDALDIVSEFFGMEAVRDKKEEAAVVATK